MRKVILIGSVIIIALLFSAYEYGFRSATEPPDSRPAVFLSSGERTKTVVVCIGDSITHGRVSYNYVKELERRNSDPDYTFINAGINSELSYNVLHRIDQIVRCRPDFVTLLIGTNDVLATLNDKNNARYVRKMGLPRSPDRQEYEENLTAIVDVLQRKTTAKIALLSLPPITEEKTHIAYKRAASYSRFIKKLAEERDLDYLPLNERMDQALSIAGKTTKSAYTGGDVKIMYTAIFSHFFLKKNWDDISKENGFIFMTDNIHLNRKAGMMVADLIEKFIH
jgi:lysophospholipase L1-like esterase